MSTSAGGVESGSNTESAESVQETDAHLLLHIHSLHRLKRTSRHLWISGHMNLRTILTWTPNPVFQFWKTVQTFSISFKLASWVDNCIIKIIRARSFQNKRETTRIEHSGKKVPHDSSIQFCKQYYQTRTDLYKLLEWDLVVSVCVCLTDCPVRDAAQLKQTQQ